TAVRSAAGSPSCPARCGSTGCTGRAGPAGRPCRHSCACHTGCGGPPRCRAAPRRSRPTPRPAPGGSPRTAVSACRPPYRTCSFLLTESSPTSPYSGSAVGPDGEGPEQWTTTTATPRDSRPAGNCSPDCAPSWTGNRPVPWTMVRWRRRWPSKGRELLRQLYQDHLDLRAQRERRLTVVADADGLPRTSVEPGHHRALATVFGTVDVQRMAYRRRGQPNLHPADAMLNLPAERHSHGLRRLAAEAAAHGSFDHATGTIRRRTGTRTAKRQVEALATRAAADVADFYATRPQQPTDPGDALVLTFDGKGI